jgi:hypothetical protein
MNLAGILHAADISMDDVIAHAVGVSTVVAAGYLLSRHLYGAAVAVPRSL